MRTLIIAALLCTAFGAGYLTHAKLADPAPQRADRSTTNLDRSRIETLAELTEEEREFFLNRNFPELVRMREEARTTAAPTGPGAEEEGEAPESASPDKADDQIEAWLKSASGQWKAYAGMQAKSKVRGLLAGLGFDAATAKQIEDAIVADVERQVDLAIEMMLGDKELDPNVFTAMLGIPADLSEALETELAGYLDDEAIGAVRERVQSAHAKQMTDMADMQVNSMGIRDLSADQKKRMREVFVGRDMMTQQMSQFSDLTRNRKKMMTILQDEEAFTAAVKQSMEPQRRRVRDILNDAQFKRYEAYEQNVLQQAKMGMKMMSAMIKPEEK